MNYIKNNRVRNKKSRKIHHLKRRIIFWTFVLLICFFIVSGIMVVSTKEDTKLLENPAITVTAVPSAVPTEAAELSVTPKPTVTPVPSLTSTPTPIPTEIPVYDQILVIEQKNENNLTIPVKAALLVNITNDEVLCSYKATEQLYPASITKLMTALTVFQQKVTLDEIVTISKNAVTPVIPDAKMCGFKKGDQISLYELLECMLLYSGNDSAIAVAEHISGTEEEFVTLMNVISEEMGLSTSNFCNSHGLPDDNHVTSAYDIYRIMEKLFNYDEFLDIIELSSIEVDILRDGEVKALTFSSTNQFLNGTYEIPDGITLIGGKTGTTNKAGCCLSIYVTDENGDCYIAEIFGAESYDSLYKAMIQLLEYISEK